MTLCTITHDGLVITRNAWKVIHTLYTITHGALLFEYSFHVLDDSNLRLIIHINFYYSNSLPDTWLFEHPSSCSIIQIYPHNWNISPSTRSLKPQFPLLYLKRYPLAVHPKTLLTHPQFAARTPGNIPVLAGSEKDVLLGEQRDRSAE